MCSVREEKLKIIKYLPENLVKGNVSLLPFNPLTS